MSLLHLNVRSCASALTVLLCLGSPTAWADTQADTIAELRAQLIALTARLETLEAQQQRCVPRCSWIRVHEHRFVAAF